MNVVKLIKVSYTINPKYTETKLRLKLELD